MSKSRQQVKDDLRVEMAEYVKARRRWGRPLTFAAVLSGQIQAATDYALTDPEGYWLERRSLLHEIAREEHLAP